MNGMTFFHIMGLVMKMLLQLKKKLLRFRSRFIGWFRGRSVRRRFSLIMIFFCVIPLIISASVVFLTSYYDAVGQYTSFAEQLTAQMENNLRSRLLRLRTDAIDLAYNLDIQEFVHSSSRTTSLVGNMPITDEVAHAITSKFNTTSDGAGLMLFTPAGATCYTYNNRSALSMYFREPFKQHVIQNINSSKSGYWHYTSTDDYYMKNLEGRMYAPVTQEPVIFYALKMKRIVGSEYVGYLVMTLRSGLLNELFEGGEFHGLSTVYLLDENGNTIVHSGLQSETLSPQAWNLVRSSKEKGIHSASIGSRFIRDRVIYTKLSEIGWYVAEVIDGDALSMLALRNCASILLLMLFALLLIPLVFLIMNYSIDKPLSRILTDIARIQQGEFSARINDKGNDEFSQISNSIDTLSGRLEDMIEKVKLSEQRYSESQIELLQMQINPHFITNTLNTVAWMADLQNQTNISRVVSSLSALLNQTLRSGREFVTLEEELQYVRWYVDIQQYRGTLRYQLHLQVDDDLLSCKLPPFTLEPLVENSVTHGAVPGRSTLDITIKALRSGDTIICTVIDNGSGMSPETLRRIESSTGEHNGKLYRVHGIGIPNVRKRLQLYFGEEYGLSYDSIPGQFTMATIRFPAEPPLPHREERNEYVSFDDHR